LTFESDVDHAAQITVFNTKTAKREHTLALFNQRVFPEIFVG